MRLFVLVYLWRIWHRMLSICAGTMKSENYRGVLEQNVLYVSKSFILVAGHRPSKNTQLENICSSGLWIRIQIICGRSWNLPYEEKLLSNLRHLKQFVSQAHSSCSFFYKTNLSDIFEKWKFDKWCLVSDLQEIPKIQNWFHFKTCLWHCSVG